MQNKKRNSLRLSHEGHSLGLFASCYPSQRPSGYLVESAKADSNGDSRTQSVLGNIANNPTRSIRLVSKHATVNYKKPRKKI